MEDWKYLDDYAEWNQKYYLKDDPILELWVRPIPRTLFGQVVYIPRLPVEIGESYILSRAYYHKGQVWLCVSLEKTLQSFDYTDVMKLRIF